jgi:predicted nuclease of restriction endonuclease-like (RecB) superfamily
MKKKPATTTKTKSATLYKRIREILESARAAVARSVNSAQVMANWLIGGEIIEEQQRGSKRARYGEGLLAELARRLSTEFGKGWSERHLEYCRTFYLTYPKLLERKKSNAVRSISAKTADDQAIPNPVRSKLEEQWKPGTMHSNLSWTHYRRLLRVSGFEARTFYEIESIKNNWSARELERQINSLLYERLARSRDKAGLMRLATRGQEIAKPDDIFKDPVVIEFLGLPETPRLVETRLEKALINNLQAFLLELGTGFAFVARQKRITLDGNHFYIDLVFYHTILKCFVVIDLKVGKLTHQDLGQLQLYVNYFDREISSADDNPTLGLILCTDKNEAVVKYTLGPEQEKKIFASRYKLYLPTEAELQDEIRRELKILSATEAVRGKRVTASARTRKRTTK